MTASKPLVIGEACGDDGTPLCGPSGRRLGGLVGLSLEEFLDRVEVVNVLARCPGRDPGRKGFRFPLALATAGADGLDLRGRRVLLLGLRVASAFGRGGARVRPPCRVDLGRGERRAWAIHHPSGIVRWWNLPENREAAGRVLAEVLGMRGGPGKSRGLRADRSRTGGR